MHRFVCALCGVAGGWEWRVSRMELHFPVALGPLAWTIAEPSPLYVDGMEVCEACFALAPEHTGVVWLLEAESDGSLMEIKRRTLEGKQKLM
jgi:hypothetical protein